MRAAFALFFLLLSAPQVGTAQASMTEAAVDAASTITPEEVRAAMEFLAHDSLGGRDTPSPGLETAAGWIARELEGMGLEPGGDAGSYVQRYAMTPRGGGDPVQVPNVVGLLRGTDPELREEWVVFTAHFDHVSGPADARGDSIYNGADDNASGTAAILEVAEAFTSLSTPPRRSLAFVLVSGEEKGLLGAGHFAGGASIPVQAQVADINADMVSRNWTDSILVHGAEYSTLGATLEEVLTTRTDLGVYPMEDRWPQIPFVRMSDQYAFIAQGTPGIFFFGGLHEDLHRPSDEVDGCDCGKAARVARLIFYLGYEVAQDDEAPAWTDAGKAFLAEIGAGVG